MPDLRALDRSALASARRLRRTILDRIGIAGTLLVGCTPATSGEDDAGVTTNPTASGEDSSGDADGPGSTSTSESSDSDSSDDEMESETTGFALDLPPEPPGCEATWYGAEFPAEEYPSCEFSIEPEVWAEYFELCVPLGDNASCEDICDVDGMCAGMDQCWLGEVYEICGPFQAGDSCCSLFLAEPPPPVGRPFTVDGELRLPEIQLDADAQPSSFVAVHWREMARGEHASIAAFARFVGVLQAHAAPPGLIIDSLAASADEARHSRSALDLASRFAGRPVVLGGLDVERASSQGLEEALRAAVIEGCIGETLAAHEAACLAEHAEDSEVAEVLQRIAADEARHASLAWRFVAWVLDARPELRRVVREAFAETGSGPAVGTGIGAEPWLAWGCPSTELRIRWKELGRAELIAPCAARLMAMSAPRASYS